MNNHKNNNTEQTENDFITLENLTGMKHGYILNKMTNNVIHTDWTNKKGLPISFAGSIVTYIDAPIILKEKIRKNAKDIQEIIFNCETLLQDENLIGDIHTNPMVVLNRLARNKKNTCTEYTLTNGLIIITVNEPTDSKPKSN